MRNTNANTYLGLDGGGGQSTRVHAIDAQATSPGTSSSTPTWTMDKVRSEFVDFFKTKKAHTFVPSSPVVPYDDPTILFANAGMNQFKPIFLGQLDPSSPLSTVTRAVNSQKCIRAGGKHNDLEDVGKDTYHHTFFEMLGSWSFGDYFKKEAIEWAYELLTDVYGLNPDRMYATYFGGDEKMGLEPDLEARDFWLQFLPASRVLPFGTKDNFWEMGDVGPCGPCSELHYDRIGGRDASELVNMDDPNVIEIWNLVFIQYNRERSGELKALPAKHVDTGMGLERVVSIMQDKDSNYDIDGFEPLLKAVHKAADPKVGEYQGLVTGEDQEGILRDTAYRVVVDHVRTLSFAIADGAMPSNEGRGYVLRRILRRAVRYGEQILGCKKGFFSAMVPVMVDTYADTYPELRERAATVQEVLEDEEKAFSSMLERGVRYLNDLEAKLIEGKTKTLPGTEAFYLYDTLGFPLDLTQLMAAEKGLSVDVAGFEAEMSKQKKMSREALAKQKTAHLGDGAPVELQAEQTAWLKDNGVKVTDDGSKYEWDVKVATKVAAIYNPNSKEFTDTLTKGENVGLILEASSFYAESGGQVADKGVLNFGDGNVFRVYDVQMYAGYVVHIGRLEEGDTLRVQDEVTCSVDYEHRRDVAPNHTMTHVLNFALRRTLGDLVDQKGSLVDSEKLRFDFSHKKALSVKELVEVEESVRSIVKRQLPVHSKVIPLKAAQSINSLRAVFGEVYPDPVRVVSVGAEVNAMEESPSDEKWGGYSVELCGGTHIGNTQDAETFVIVEETAIAKGVRRIVALTRGAAREAEKRGSELKEKVDALTKVALGEAGPQVGALREEVDAAVISAALKPTLRDTLSGISKKVMDARKKELAKLTDQRIEDALKAAQDAQDAGRPAMVHKVSLGLDAKLINKVANAVNKAFPSLSLMFVSEDEPGSGGPVLCVAMLPKEAVEAGLVASEWNANALEKWGGKGGGKPNSAQARASACDDVDSLMQIACDFAQLKLSSS